MESVVNREVAAANRLRELTISGEALEQRQASAQEQAADLERLRKDLEARQLKSEEQVSAPSPLCEMKHLHKMIHRRLFCSVNSPNDAFGSPTGTAIKSVAFFPHIQAKDLARREKELAKELPALVKRTEALAQRERTTTEKEEEVDIA